jgi:hypothetical protein
VIARILLAALLLQVGTTPPKASIEGVVLQFGTNQPVADVRVSLDGHENPVVTKEDGKFSFKGIDPFAHTYRLIFSANGYVRREYGSALDLSAGQALTGLVVRLTPTGSVTGRLQDSDNKPLSGVRVDLLKPGYDASGKRVLRKFGTARTNDLGEYRLYFLTPGTYNLIAAPLRGIEDLYDGELGRNEVRETYAPSLYPRPIEVQLGVTTRGIDLTLKSQQLFRVRGRITDASTGQTPPRGEAVLHLRDPATGEDRGLDNIWFENGAFEFSGVVPGTYSISATVEDPVPVNETSRIRQAKFGIAAVTVLTSDIDGVSITVKPGATISGRVRIESGESNVLSMWSISTGGPPAGARLSAIPAGFSRPVFSPLAEGNAFQVYNLMPGEYLFSIPWLRSAFVKEAWFGGADILNRPLRFTGSESGPMEIVISSKTGTLSGKVNSPAQVVVVPDRRERVERYRAVATDQNGRFNVPEIAPGDYRVFAWESLEPYAYFDPDLLRRSESRSMRVQIAESSKQAIELQVIPAP